ncbi:RNA polymerase sigma-70 factor, ECF subfamily [Microlunatus flavus]|uniref:RNA polymerase sigma-70 factor, ECF subfamily n=1 Tax=Microlunatus flavus TaxID=1036181 RepID=A0A1H9H2T7_9ACTN|nr:RNA polymerase sigma-70 factor, ECF subfamily [Microlunatus flavus]
MLASLVRQLGDWSLAQDAVQEASLAALETWPARGMPDEPRAWLIATARRKAVDMLRRERARGDKERDGVALVDQRRRDEPAEGDPSGLPAGLEDDLLRLLFTCCHPSLAPEARLALALRTLCQLSVAQVAAVLLTTETAMARRLGRTRQKITAARIPYRVPAAEELPERLGAVCGVVHATYTAGHAPLVGDALVDVDLCAEAVRLARLLVATFPDEPAPTSVLALLLLTEARRPARADADGEVVLLPDQDRGRWDSALVVEGAALLATSLRRSGGVADPYQLQAAVALEHDRAPSYAATDWAEIVRLYDLLVSVAPSPAASLARAVALAERDGPEAGLAALDGLGGSHDARVRGVRGELLARTGRRAEAAQAVEPRADDELTAPERRFRERRVRAWRALAGEGAGGQEQPGQPPRMSARS